MSKIVKIQIQCPKCNKQYDANVFRTLWGDGCTADDFENRLTDKTNMVTCPHCGHSFRLPLGLMYVDCKMGFAVWWEPQHDEGIDIETKSFATMFGTDSYYAQAPRIKDWGSFKETIRRYYTGEYKTNPITKLDINALKQQISSSSNKSKSGCLGIFMLGICTINICYFLNVI